MLNIFGGNHEEIGSTDKNLIFKTQGKIRIQWGKKFIDLLDNDGNINCGLKNIISTVSSEDSIKKDGFYYLDGALIACVGGKKIIISSESGNTFVSFLVEQDTTDEQKQLAQKNIGFYYDTKKDINITNGIAYVEDEGTLYIINNGNISQFSASIPNPYPKQFVINKEDQTSKGSLIITGSGETNGLMFDTLSIFSDNGAIYKSNVHKFFSGDDEIVQITNDGVITKSIQSENASSLSGYRIYNNKGKYILDIDSINVRDGLNISPNIYPLEYYPNKNIITNTKNIEDSKVKCYLKYINTYKVGDTLLVYDPLNLKEIELNILESAENYITTNNIEISNLSNVKCDLINEDLAIGNIKTKYNSKNVGIISKQNIFYSTKFDKEGSGDKIYPFYSNTLYEELEPNIEKYNYVIPPIGLIKKLQLVHSAEYIKKDKKIYFKDYSGNNLFTIDATDFIKDGMVSNVYVERKNLYITFNTDAGKDTITIPISKIFDSSKYYTKLEIDSMISSSSASSTPIGTILMWPGSNLPEGYLICNGGTFNKEECPELYNILGSNKLPDLRDRFIVGAGNEYNLGNTGGEKEHTLTVEELPSHKHIYSSIGDNRLATRYGSREDAVQGDSNYGSAWDYETQAVGNNQPHENRPPYYALYFIIRASNSAVTPPEPSPEPEPDPETTTNMTITISNNTGSKIYASRLDFIGTSYTQIDFEDTYEIVSSKTITVSVNESIIGLSYTSIQVIDDTQQHCAYLTDSGEGTISTVISVTATQKI